MDNIKDLMRSKTAQKIITVILLSAGVLFAFFMTYKAKVRTLLDKDIQCTLMSEHKDNDTVVLSGKDNRLSETFLCTVPTLKRITLQAKAVSIRGGEKMTLTLTDAQSDQIWAQKEITVKKSLKKNSPRYLELKLKKAYQKSEGRLLRLDVEMERGCTSEIAFTSNQKQEIVREFNQSDEDRSNVIYHLSYGNAKQLSPLYWIVCGMLFLFLALCYYFFIWKRYDLKRVFFPTAVVLGTIMNFVIMAHGVPDEPSHIDTAYKYSNYLLFEEDTGEKGTIYKRTCDARMSDMLANGLETNSYYQLKEHFFERPKETETIAVSYADTSLIVPGIVYIPAAVGIAVGRLLGCSFLLAVTLGRICNLVAFAGLISLSIRIIPYGKNLLGMIMLLPIAMQQAASASYDPMIIGYVVLFVSLCLRAAEGKTRRKGELLLTLLLMGLIFMTKGGVYTPVCLLFFARPIRDKLNKKYLGNRKLMILTGIGIVLLAGVACLMTAPMIQRVLSAETIHDGESLYSLGYLLRHPLRLAGVFWNTLAYTSGTRLQDLLGGRLSWLNVKINWSYSLFLWTGLLLLANIEGEKYKKKKKVSFLLSAASVLVILSVMASMLLAFTTAGSDSIQGLQGRYYLPVIACVLLLAATDKVSVKKRQVSGILFAMMSVNLLIVLQAVTIVLA